MEMTTPPIPASSTYRENSWNSAPVVEAYAPDIQGMISCPMASRRVRDSRVSSTHRRPWASGWARRGGGAAGPPAGWGGEHAVTAQSANATALPRALGRAPLSKITPTPLCRKLDPGSDLELGRDPDRASPLDGEVPEEPTGRRPLTHVRPAPRQKVRLHVGEIRE